MHWPATGLSDRGKNTSDGRKADVLQNDADAAEAGQAGKRTTVRPFHDAGGPVRQFGICQSSVPGKSGNKKCQNTGKWILPDFFKGDKHI